MISLRPASSPHPEAALHAPAAPRPASCAGAGTGFPVAECQCRVIGNSPVNAEYRLLVAEADAVALAARPGQFFHLLCPPSEAGRPFLRRPMSIHLVDRAAGRIGFLYKVTGRGTRGLATLQPGDTLDALGPLGRGFRLPEGTRHVLMVARGVGLATLAPLAGLATASGARVTAVLSARSPDLVMARDTLEAAGAAVIVVTDTDGRSDPARLRAMLEARHAEGPFDFVATCGSNRLFHLVRDLARGWGIPGQVALEARMGCGLGLCYACVVPVTDDTGAEDYARVCWDGPVFSLAEAREW